MDSDIQIPIHNKHMDHKNLQKEIKPQVPTIKPPKKIKDPEGLGRRIPIENIGAIATNIGAAALTGGAAAAGEALVMGGTAGLMGAGESILGASIGSGVAAGASTGLGHSDAANIASGIIGGVTGRTVGRVLQNRRIRNQNVQPTGNRLGGSRGGRETSRLIADIQDPNIPRPNVPAPGEPTQTSNPFTRLKRSIAKRVKDTTDKIKSIKQQISKPYTPLQTDAAIQPIGTSTTDYNKQQFPPVPQLHEPIQREQITLPEDLEFRYFQQEQKQLQRKYLEELKGGHTNPDISQLRDLTDSGAHWESNPLSRSKKAIAIRENTPINNKMMDNIRQIIAEEDGIRAKAASKIKQR
jgi:hypothetical protein